MKPYNSSLLLINWLQLYLTETVRTITVEHQTFSDQVFNLSKQYLLTAWGVGAGHTLHTPVHTTKLTDSQSP